MEEDHKEGLGPSFIYDLHMLSSFPRENESVWESQVLGTCICVIYWSIIKALAFPEPDLSMKVMGLCASLIFLSCIL